MKIIELSPLLHKNRRQIAVRFAYDDEIRVYLKQLEGIRWSQTHACFYLAYSIHNKKLLFNHLRKKNYFIDYSSFQQVAEGKKEKRGEMFLPDLNESCKKDLKNFEKFMQEKRLSGNTVKTYLEVTALFLKYALLKERDSLDVPLIEEFNYDYIVKSNKSISYQNQCINGIKKFLEFSGNPLEKFELVRPRREKRLPEVLSLEEVKSIIEATINLKHQTLLSLIYSAGLRIGEALNMRMGDIDSQRMLIHVKKAKGKKDRFTLLSGHFLELSRIYYKKYRPHYYFFEGANGKKYSASSAQHVLRRAVNRVGISKRVTLHTLRHSFATHLLENGTDIRYIQALLGHNSPKTTMIYTHVSNQSLKNIKNPFDSI